MKESFKLFASCIPVKGVNRSTICDLQRGIIKFIPNDLYDLLVQFDGCEINKVIEHFGIEHKSIIDEYFEFLIDNDLIFLTKTPERFPRLELNWETPELVSNGIVDVNTDSQHNWKDIFTKYDEVRCKHLQLRFFSLISLTELSEIIKLTNKGMLNTIDILVPYDQSYIFTDLNKFLSDFYRVVNIVIHSTDNKELIKNKHNNSKINFISQTIDSNTHCGNISLDYFRVNQFNFIESNNANSCLNAKISIDINGDIKNCPSMIKTYGNIKKDSFRQAIKTPSLIQSWGQTKDEIEVCKDCEFRYVCTDCRAFLESDNSKQKPKKCNYDPYKLEWVE